MKKHMSNAEADAKHDSKFETPELTAIGLEFDDGAGHLRDSSNSHKKARTRRSRTVTFNALQSPEELLKLFLKHPELVATLPPVPGDVEALERQCAVAQYTTHGFGAPTYDSAVWEESPPPPYEPVAAVVPVVNTRGITCAKSAPKTSISRGSSRTTGQKLTEAEMEAKKVEAMGFFSLRKYKYEEGFKAGKHTRQSPGPSWAMRSRDWRSEEGGDRAREG
ncbi:hypothetical protein CALVIDRAFT_568736 [Calocera viscosa TUFC12733]|uniref:Uncharacterized protein n=1 Tax=Calocera viscosa (strain TUFC12733) TaxID=1330018 RepID=A0A167GSP1_CALVF|nr:hypothetical protein CALVIDRAFT_568736 [Calocera viscosa TUFC12733]